MNDQNTSPDARVKELIDSLIKAGVDTKTPEVQGYILSLLSEKDAKTQQQQSTELALAKPITVITKDGRYVLIKDKVEEMGYPEELWKNYWRSLGKMASTARKQGILKGMSGVHKHCLYLNCHALEQFIQDFFAAKEIEESEQLQVIKDNINSRKYVAVIEKTASLGYSLSTCKEFESDLSVFLKTKTKIPSKAHLNKKSKGEHLFLDSEELDQAIQEFMNQNTTPLLFRLESNSTPVDNIPSPISVTNKALEMDYPKLLVRAYAHSLGMFVKKHFNEKGIKHFHNGATHNYENCPQLGELVGEFFEAEVKEWKGRMAT